MSRLSNNLNALNFYRLTVVVNHTCGFLHGECQFRSLSYEKRYSVKILGMARTKQTARESTGDEAPRKECPSVFSSVNDCVY